MEKWLIPGLGQGKYKMSLKHFAPESKEVLNKYGGQVSRTEEPAEGCLKAKADKI